MKLTLIAVGSRGDVQPCVALGRGLLAAGHQARIVTLNSFEALARDHGLEFFGIAGDAQALTQQMMRVNMAGKGPRLLQMYRGIMRTFGAITRQYEQAFAAETLRDSEAILSQLPGGFYGYDLAEALGVPYFALSVIPQEITGAWPFSMFPSRRSFGRRYNRLTYRIAQQLAWPPFRASIQRFRKQLGLAPTSFWWGSMRRMQRERVPVLQGFSEHVIPHQPEWGEHVHTTGYWMLDESDWTPPPTLVDFLENGEPPIFIGFGSMSMADPRQTTDTLLKAVEHSGQRAILHAGWAELRAAAVPETVFALDYAPYDWLFPRMAAIIHHGGSGTTGFALRSGVPSMVVPFTADQPFWGERTHQLGVGLPPLPFAKLSAEPLASAIRTLCEDESLRRRAQQLAAAMADEQGVERAVMIINRYLNSQVALKVARKQSS